MIMAVVLLAAAIFAAYCEVWWLAVLLYLIGIAFALVDAADRADAHRHQPSQLRRRQLDDLIDKGDQP